MAIAFDAFSASAANQTDTTSFTWTHTPTGTPRGILVFVVQGGTGSTGDDEVTGVTYGGTTMTEVANSPHVKTSGEAGAVYGYFLGASVPTGAQDVVVSTNAGSRKIGFAISFTAAQDTEIVATDIDINSDAVADPTGTIALGGVTSYVAEALMSGQNNVGGIAPNTGWTERAEDDHGASVVACYTFDTIGSSDVTYGWTQATDDALATAVAVRESAAAGAAVAGTHYYHHYYRSVVTGLM